MQKTLSQVNGCSQRARTESEWYEGAQTFLWITEENVVEVPFDKEHLFEAILNPDNMNNAYKAVVRTNWKVPLLSISDCTMIIRILLKPIMSCM